MPYTPKDALRDRRRLDAVDAEAEWQYRIKSAVLYLYEMWESPQMMVMIAAFLLWCVGIVTLPYDLTMGFLLSGVAVVSTVCLLVDRWYLMSNFILMAAFSFILLQAVTVSHYTAMGMTGGTLIILLNGVFRYAQK